MMSLMGERGKLFTFLSSERSSCKFCVFFCKGVVVKGKCQVLMFSDFVSPTPFKRLERLFPRLRQAFAL